MRGNGERFARNRALIEIIHDSYEKLFLLFFFPRAPPRHGSFFFTYKNEHPRKTTPKKDFFSFSVYFLWICSRFWNTKTFFVRGVGIKKKKKEIFRSRALSTRIQEMSFVSLIRTFLFLHSSMFEIEKKKKWEIDRASFGWEFRRLRFWLHLARCIDTKIYETRERERENPAEEALPTEWKYYRRMDRCAFVPRSLVRTFRFKSPLRFVQPLFLPRLFLPFPRLDSINSHWNKWKILMIHIFQET